MTPEQLDQLLMRRDFKRAAASKKAYYKFRHLPEKARELHLEMRRAKFRKAKATYRVIRERYRREFCRENDKIDNLRRMGENRKICPKLKREKRILNSTRHRARKLNIPFNITLEDVRIPGVCPVLNIPLTIENKRLMDNSPTLDKVIPTLGYVKGNVIVVSFRANRIKSNSSWQELETISRFYKDFYESKATPTSTRSQNA